MGPGRSRSPEGRGRAAQRAARGNPREAARLDQTQQKLRRSTGRAARRGAPRTSDVMGRCGLIHNATNAATCPRNPQTKTTRRMARASRAARRATYFRNSWALVGPLQATAPRSSSQGVLKPTPRAERRGRAARRSARRASINTPTPRAEQRRRAVRRGARDHSGALGCPGSPLGTLRHLRARHGLEAETAGREAKAHRAARRPSNLRNSRKPARTLQDAATSPCPKEPAS